MLLRAERFPRWERLPRWGQVLVVGSFIVFLGLALWLRISLFPIETSDYTAFLSPWYTYIQTHGGLAALKDNFANYNTPYLTLFALASYLPIPQLIAIKSISVIFDGVLALFTYLLLRLKYGRSLAAAIGMLVLLFAPTIFINSAAWGQCDAIYAAFCLGSLYFLLKHRPGWACSFFGLALAFKLQAIFFAPVLLVLLVKRYLPPLSLLLIPLVFFLSLTPALIAGRSMVSLLEIYPQQISSGGSGGVGAFQSGGLGSFNPGSNAGLQGGAPGGFGGANGYGHGQPAQGNNPGSSGTNNRPTFGGGGRGFGRFNGNGGGQGDSTSSLTLNAPSFYQWLPASAPVSFWKWVGIIVAALFILIISALFLLSKQQLTIPLMLKLALLFAVAIPFLLPEMHERYFYLADVLSIIYAFFFARLFFVAIIMQLCSLLSYAPYLLHRAIVPLPYVAGAVLILLLILLIDLVYALYPGLKRPVPASFPHDAHAEKAG